jgi:EAL domain-containing protein (putative c-di-GMP-specific phosphodiesterase class I)
VTQLEALKQIAARDGGLLRPAAVVEAARDEDSPLHDAFCWDDTEAAKRYRILQAQKLIRSFRVVVEDQETPVFVNLSVDRVGDSEENPYRLVETLRDDTDLLAVAERDALEQLKGLRERYGHLKRLNSIWSAIDKAG